MSVSNLYGTISERIGDNAIIKVHTHKGGGPDIHKEDDIFVRFPPKGEVFSPKFFRRHTSFKLGDIVKISVKEFQEKDGELVLVVIDNDCQKAGFPLFNIEKSSFISECSIKVESLVVAADGDIPELYLCDEGSIFGPFKKQGAVVSPKYGKDVDKYSKKETPIISFNENAFLLNKPTDQTKISHVDCMTSSQVVEWLKKKLTNLAEIDLNLIKKLVQDLNLDGIEKDRFLKATKIISQVNLNYRTVKELSQINEDFRRMFADEVSRISEEIRAEYHDELIRPLERSKTDMQAEIVSLGARKQKLVKQLDQDKVALAILNEEFTLLSENKERLIDDIRLRAIVATSDISPKNHLTTFEVIDYSCELPRYESLKDFCRLIVGVDENSRRIIRCVFLLTEYRAFLSNDIEFVLKIASATNNCKVYIQQVEADWLKFNYLLENGLQQIWRSAHEEPNKIHFLLLQDFNIASIECYGRPLLDLLSKIRTKLPGENSPFPSNLWIFCFPVNIEVDDDFGLPLIRKTFNVQHWGGFKKDVGKEVVFSAGVEQKCLFVDALRIGATDNPVPSSLNDYFKQ